MAPRVTYRRHNSFNTRSNKIRKVKTPGIDCVKLTFNFHFLRWQSQCTIPKQEIAQED